MIHKKKGLAARWWWWRPFIYIVAILIIPVAAFLINAPIFLFFHVMPASICYMVVHPDNNSLIDLCFILGQYHWIAEIGLIGLLVFPCFIIFYGVDCCSYKERRKKNKKHAANLGRCFTAIAIGLVVSLIVTGPYQIAMLRVCRPGGYGLKFVSTPTGAVEHNSKYYVIHGPDSSALTYQQSMGACKKISHHLGFEPPFGTAAVLASIETEKEQTFITQFLNEHHNRTIMLRIGGIKEPPLWKYYWNKGSYGRDYLSYTHWSPNAENEGWGNCLSMKRTENATGTGTAEYYWIPESCVRHRYLSYLCEMPAQLNYMLCTWVTGSIYVAVLLELFTVGFIIHRIIQRRRTTEVEFPQDIPALIITPADSQQEFDFDL